MSSLRYLFRFKHPTSTPFTDVTKKLILLLVFVTTIVYVGVCAFSYSENKFGKGVVKAQNENLTIIDLFYFIVTTVTTVGYGDITPNSAPGKLTIILVMMTGIAIVPSLVTDFQRAIASSQDGLEIYTPPENHPFIAIFFNGDFLNIHTRIIEMVKVVLGKKPFVSVLLVSRGKAPKLLRKWTRDTKNHARVSYMLVESYDKGELKRTAITDAYGAILVSELQVTKLLRKKNDEQNMCRAMALLNYAPRLRLFCETVYPESQYMYEDLEVGLGLAGCKVWGLTL